MNDSLLPIRGATPKPGGSAWRELLETGKLGQFALLSLGIWLYAADSLLTATIIPTVVEQIGGVRYVNWTISLYQVGAIIAGATAALLLRRRSLRTVMIHGATLYGAGCALGALAPSMPVFLVARVAQGAGGGLMMAMSYIAVQVYFPEHLWTRLMAIEAAMWSIGSLLGPLIGGVFAEFGHWRFALWSFAFQAGALVVAARLLINGARDSTSKHGKTPWRSILLLSAATLCIAEAGVTPATPAVLLILLGMVLLSGAAYGDAKAPNPLLPRQFLDVSHPLGAGLLMIFMLSAATTGFWTYGPLILRSAFGVGALTSGYILAAESLAWSGATVAISGLGPRYERRVIGAGVALAIAGAIGFAPAVRFGSLAGIILCVLLQGGGFGMFWPYSTRRILLSATEGDGVLAAGAMPTVQRIGYAVGAAAAGIAANRAGLSDGAPADLVRRAGFWMFAAFVPALIAAGFLTRSFLGAKPARPPARLAAP